MFATTTAVAVTMTTPMITGRSCCWMAWYGGEAEAGHAEHDLGDDRAAEQDADVDAELGDDRRQRRAQRVPEDHPPLGQALRPCGADVVLTHDVEHRPARQPGVDGGGDQREGDPGQDQPAEPLERAGGERRVAGTGERVDAVDRELVVEAVSRSRKPRTNVGIE